MTTEPERRAPTPHEIDLQRQVKDLSASLQRQRAEHARQVADLQKRPAGLAQHVKDAEASCRRMRGEIGALERRLQEADRIVADYAARLNAAAQRREEAYRVLTVLVAAEDNASLSDAEYDARIDACVRRARTLLSLEAKSK